MTELEILKALAEHENQIQRLQITIRNLHRRADVLEAARVSLRNENETLREENVRLRFEKKLKEKLEGKP